MTKNMPHGTTEVSPWVKRFASLVSDNGEVLDLACGGGSNTRHFLGRGHPVTALDRSIDGVYDLASNPSVEIVGANLENDLPWPLPDRQFAGIVVTKYLYRPLFPMLINALADGGILIYETFGVGNERYGHPRNPDFLLQNHELLELVKDHLTVIAFEQGIAEGDPHPRVLQRICAAKRSDAEPLALFTN